MTHPTGAAWGVDGCKAGWFYFRLPPPPGDITCGLVTKLRALFDCKVRTSKDSAPDADIATEGDLMLVDIPIGLEKGVANGGSNERACDIQAKEMLRPGGSAPKDFVMIGDRSRSVFRTPVRETLEVFESDLGPGATKAQKAEERRRQFDDARQCNIDATDGMSVSAQAFGILRKVAEVDQLFQANDTARRIVRETHPEVCFSALNGRPMDFKKKHGWGFRDRVDVLDRHFGDRASKAIEDASRWCFAHRGRKGFGGRCCRKMHSVGGDDLVDAMVCAVTAWLILRDKGSARALPHCEPPRNDVADRPDPPEIVYAVPSTKSRDEKGSCSQ